MPNVSMKSYLTCISRQSGQQSCRCVGGQPKQAIARKKQESAISKPESARELAGDNWDDTDRALMQTYLEEQ